MMLRYGQILQNIAFWLSVFVVVASPWIAFSNESLGCFLLGLVTLFALLIACFYVLSCGKCDKEDLVFFCFFILYILSFLFQIVPLESMFSYLPPVFSANAWKEASSLLKTMKVANIIGKDLHISHRFLCISLSPSSTLHALVLFVNYAAVFMVIVLCARNWQQISAAATATTLSACFVLLTAVFLKEGGTYGNFWSWARIYGGDAIGPFSNRNHFALYMNIAFIIAAVMTWISTALLVSRHPNRNLKMEFFYAMDFASEVPLRLFISALLAVGVFFSLSRGGMLSWVLVMMVISFFFIKRGGIHRSGKGKEILIVMIIVMVVLMISLGWQKIFIRLFHWSFGGDRTEDMGRLKVLPYVFNLLANVWTTGCGYGAFRHIFPVFQGIDVQFGRWTHSHNELLQIATEGGVFAFLLLCAGIVLMLQNARKTIAAKETRISFVGIAFIAVICLALFHGLFDYGLRKPPNAWTFSLLLAMGVVVRKFSREYQNSVYAVNKCFLTRMMAMGVVILIMIIFWFEWNIFVNTVKMTHFKLYNSAIKGLPSGTKNDIYIRRMINETQDLNLSYCLPDETRKISEIYTVMAMNKNLDIKLRIIVAQESLRFAYSSVKMAPTEYLGWLQLGRALAVMGEWGEAWQCLDMANKMSGFRIKNVLFK